MSGFQGANTAEGGNQFAQLSATSALGSDLTRLLLADDIQPGSPPSYETCRTIYVSHPLGAKLAEVPVNMAQSQDREITVPGAPESRLIPAFEREWQNIGRVGADTLINNTMRLARVYGIASLVMGDLQSKSSDPIEWTKLHERDLFFNVLDPLNTAGSLVLNQDPNAPDYQKPKVLRAGGKDWHMSRAVVQMNEQPIYIQFTDSAFGFVGRSVYQRALYPLKSFIQSMVTDQTVTQKIGLLIWKAKSPGSAINNRMMSIFGWKRQQLQGGVTGNVLTIGETEAVESLNFQNLEGAGRLTRENILKNIAMAAGMPARLIDQETMASGLSDGTEDAKQIARYIDRVRVEMQPLYTFMDDVVQRRAWSPEFYKGIQKDYPEYKSVPYETAFYQWKNAFTAAWPNLLVEPDSEKAKTEEIRFKSAVAIVEVLAPLLDPENKARVISWMADEVSNRKELFSAPLVIDEDALAAYEPPAVGDEEREPEPRPFSAET